MPATAVDTAIATLRTDPVAKTALPPVGERPLATGYDICGGCAAPVVETTGWRLVDYVPDTDGDPVPHDCADHAGPAGVEYDPADVALAVAVAAAIVELGEGVEIDYTPARVAGALAAAETHRAAGRTALELLARQRARALELARDRLVAAGMPYYPCDAPEDGEAAEDGDREAGWEGDEDAFPRCSHR